jgi:phosphoglucomutase
MPFETTLDLVHRWLTWDMDPSTRVQIETLAASQDWPQLEKYLRTRIQFGTAGLRGPMVAGFANINCLTVIQASQGVASYLASSRRGAQSVVIGYDARHQSSKFARLAANAFKRKGIEPILFEVRTLRDEGSTCGISILVVANAVTDCSQQYVPTPLVSFGVRHYHADAGVMVTASHNPAQDNGYKVYLSNGAQINAPVDQLITASILENQEPWEGAWDATLDKDASAIVKDVVDAHVARVKWAFERLQPSIPADRVVVPLPISTEKSAIYTPLHGVGANYLNCVVNRVTRSSLGMVEPQRLPDPDFPTVRFPNPEEDGALDLAYLAADAAKQSLVIANDPDADRFAAAQKLPDGKWHRFTGDQMGVLLASYLLDRVDRDHIVSGQCTDTTPPSGNDFVNKGQSRYAADGTGSRHMLADHSRSKQPKIAMLTTAVSSGR